MEPPEPDEPQDRAFDDGDDGLSELAWSTPLPPDDRLWRHPSELDPSGGPTGPARLAGSAGSAGSVVTAAAPDGPRPPRGLPAWVTAAVSGVLGAVVAVGAVATTGVLSEEPTIRQTVVRETVAPAVATTAVSDSDLVVRLAARATPSIVRLEVRGELEGSGSGVLFRDDGHILTNAHVIAGSDRVVAILADGTALDARVIGTDEVTDLAVVKVDGTLPFPTAVLGSAADLEVGQPAVAIGSPLGLLGGSSVSTGVVSALHREVSSPDGPPLLDMIQTDAVIAPGSSGGALLDLDGSVIGITTAIAVSQTGAEGLGFAVPIDLAARVAAQIVDHGEAIHVWLGVEGRDLDPTDAVDLGRPGGAEVTSVVEQSPADRAALAPGDVVVAVGDRPIASMADLVVVLREHAPGDLVRLGVVRDGTERTVDVKLELRPAP